MRPRRRRLPVLLLAAALPATAAELPRIHTQNLEVGPHHRLKTPSAAAKVARDGAVVAIDAGIYLGDVAIWHQNDLTLTARGGTVRLLAMGHSAANKAVWVISGSRVKVDGIDFSGARSSDLNGAGIRFEGDDLTVTRCRFHDNQMGILTSNNDNADILIEHSEFYRNIVDYRRYGRLGHNIYVGRSAHFELRYSYVHDAVTGHEVKSRARRNDILYNRITDESGHASYLVDLPNGGNALVMGNLLHKSVASENHAAISFAAEANQNNAHQHLYVVNNTLVSDRADTVLVRNHSTATAVVANNLVQGNAGALLGQGRTLSNLILPQVGLVDAAHFDYHLVPGSLAIDAGVRDLRTPDGVSLVAAREYRHPADWDPRPVVGAPDLGAYEFVPNR